MVQLLSEALKWIAVVGGLLGILVYVVKVTRTLTESQFKVKQESLEEQNKQLNSRVSDLEGKNKDLIEAIATSRIIGRGALTKKSEIDDDLDAAMRDLQATAGSILVPEPVLKATNFVFVSIHGPAASQLRKTRVPLSKGIAGLVYSQGKGMNATDPYRDGRFFGAVDQKTEFLTKNLLCTPLHHQGHVIGVLQFLNKEQGAFDDADLRSANRFSESLAPKVAAFIGYPENFEILGISTESTAKDGAVLFCDLTASALLFESLNTSLCIDLINDYLEKISDIALHHGGTVDKYLGDGAMFRFNVPKSIVDPAAQAVDAAVEMAREFDKIKRGWLNFGLPGERIFTRSGIAFGPLHEAIVGHSQYRQLTVLGEPVNVASYLCEFADRAKNTVLIDESSKKSLDGSRSLNELVVTGKNNTVKLKCYEVVA
jgi:class 3 adenylate cyclase